MLNFVYVIGCCLVLGLLCWKRIFNMYATSNECDTFTTYRNSLSRDEFLKNDSHRRLFLLSINAPHAAYSDTSVAVSGVAVA